MGNRLGRAALGRSEMEATTRWTERKLCMGNSSRRAPLGRSEMEATIWWTEGKP